MRPVATMLVQPLNDALVLHRSPFLLLVIVGHHGLGVEAFRAAIGAEVVAARRHGRRDAGACAVSTCMPHTGSRA